MKRVVMIYPNFYPYSEWKWLPTSLIHLAAPLSEAGYEWVLLDDNLFPRAQTERDMRQLVPGADAVLISCAAGSQLRNARALAAASKLIAPDVPVIVGGPFPSACPELMLTDPNVDTVICGRGEDYIVPVIEQPGAWLPGRVYNRSMDPGWMLVPQTHTIGKLPYDQVDIEPYMSPQRAINYAASTGCVGHCTFCFWHDSWRPAWRPVELVIAELMELVEWHGIRNILFDDPTFFVSPERQMPLIEGLDLLGVGWRANARVDTLGRFSIGQMRTAHESGCHVIHVGMEAGSDSVLERMHKRTRARDVLDLAPISWETGITLRFHVLLGTPGETLAELKETAGLLAEMQKRFRDFDYTVAFFTPYPGCEMTEQAIERGWKAPATLDEWGAFEATDCKNHLPVSDREILRETDPWVEDMDVPWVACDPGEYMRRFREWIPRKATIETTGGGRETFYRSEAND